MRPVSQAPDSHRIERLGRFTIHRVIGEGGMGIVYHAIDSASNQRVALKVLQSHVARSASARARFEGEMQILADLQHPCVVRSLGAEQIDGKLVLVLEYLEGRTLRDTLTAQGALRWDHAVSVARQVASALVTAHERPRPIVHRDLKPENVMLLPGGAVKVMDFGVAKVLSEIGGVSHTTQAIGTARYLSPEQANGSGITPKVDVYGLGLLLYEMLTATAPFDGPSLVHIVRQHCDVPPPAFPPALRAQIPAELEALVFALLEKRPDARPDAARALTALDRIAEAPRPAGPTHLAASSAPVASAALVTPRAASAPSVLSGKEALDTVALIDRRTRRTWPIVAGIGALVAIGGGITTAALLMRSSSTSQTPSASARARVEPAPNLPFPIAPDPVSTSTVDDDCPPPKCARFTPPDPAHVPVDFVIARATDLARSLDPTVKLGTLIVDAPFRGGLIDLSGASARVTVDFEGADKRTGIYVSTSKLDASPPMGRRTVPLPEPFCTLGDAEAAARSRGMTFARAPRAILSVSPVDESAIWNLYEGDRPHEKKHAIIVGKGCVVRSVSADR